MLLAAAASQWSVSAAECTAKGSQITHGGSGRSATFGALAQAAAAQPVPTSPALKNPDAFTIRRTSLPRLDITPIGGQKIAFERPRRDRNAEGDIIRSEIFVVNADGSGQRRLTRDTVRDSNPVWSPTVAGSPSNATGSSTS